VNDSTVASLGIVRSGANVVLSWPQSCTTYTVENIGVLGGSWQSATGTVVAAGSNYYLTNGAPTTRIFYRLRH
jgi:hypothetical protein